MSKKINIYWDSYNGEQDQYDYIEYDHFVVLVKEGAAFTSTTFASQYNETSQRFEVDGSEFIKEAPNKEEIKLEEYQSYKFTYYAEESGDYYFSIWSVLNGEYFGPVYYPTQSQITDGVTLTISDDLDKVDVSDTMSIYGLTLSNGDYGEGFLGSPGSKDLGENTSVALIKNETSPTFSFKAKAAASAASALAFNGKARVTIREVSEDNKPSPIIFFEFYDVPIEQSSFSFADTYNSSKIVELIQGNFYQNKEEKYVVTNNFTLDRVPLRHFDVVVEGYNGKTLKTSAGNNLHDNTINAGKEGGFGDGGYDILEAKILPPESLFFLSEYSTKKGFVETQEGFDRKIPYILEPSLSQAGNLNLNFLRSTDTTTNQSVKTQAQIEDEVIDPIAGAVIYYSDQPFTLAVDQINLADGRVQKITIEDEVIEVNRTFALIDDFASALDDAPFAFSIPLPDAVGRSTELVHAVIATFDDLTYNRHFDDPGEGAEEGVIEPRVTIVNNKPVESILGEKDLAFSKIAPPLSQFNGQTDSSSGKSTFNRDQLKVGSMPFYKKPPVDSGFEAQAFRAWAYIQIDKNSPDITVTAKSGISEIKNVESSVSGFEDQRKIKIVFEDEKPYVPILIPYYKQKNGDLDVDAKPNNSEVKITNLNNLGAEIFVGTTRTTGSAVDMKIFIGFLSIT
jgi:hypothetical protein